MPWKLSQFRPQFTLRTILWTMFLVAAVIVAYKRGFQVGFLQGENFRNAVSIAYVKAYNIADLVTFDPATTSDLLYADDLKRDICNDVLPNTWTERGGPATLSANWPLRTIVIYHDRDGHERIASYLEHRRKLEQVAKQK